MKRKRVMALAMAAMMAVSLAACGGGDSDNDSGGNAGGTSDSQASGGDSAGGDSAGGEDAGGIISYTDLDLDSDCKELEATVTFFNNRTDMDSDDYAGKNWKGYIEDFNALYPYITVEVLTSADYEGDAQTHLQSGSYESVLCIPLVDKADYEAYFYPYGDYETISQTINFADNNMYNNQVYGIPSLANANGVMYNKKVFEGAGITELPKTPDEFLDAMKKIRETYGSEVDPYYTNYSAGWALSGQWDGFIGIPATGDNTYLNQKLAHTKEPFKDYGDDTHAYALYKLLYDLVAEGLTEEDYTTTDWEGCKARMNNGEIGAMVLGSWALPQMKMAGDNPDDVGYMPFPISVNGKQYTSASADRGYGINRNLEGDDLQAALIFVKWLVERSGYAYNEFSLPVVKGSESQLSFDGVEILTDEPVLAGEEDLMNLLNSDSEVNINQDGDGVRLQRVVEHAAIGDMSYDDIVAEWNEAWTSAQEDNGVEVSYE